MTEREAANRGFIVSGVVAFAELILVVAIDFISGSGPAFSYGFGSFVAIILSVIFYFIAHNMKHFGNAILLPVLGGFFLRMIIMVLLLFLARSLCDVTWFVAGLIPAMLVTIGGEIVLFARVNEFQ